MFRIQTLAAFNLAQQFLLAQDQQKNICLDISDAESSLVIVQSSNNVPYGRQHVDA